MPTKDIYHDLVKKALTKEAWLITHDPFSLQFSDADFLHIDLAAEKLIAAKKEGKKIAVEIKSFARDSALYEFHLALGQFMNYRMVLEEKEPDRVLYLAVPSDAYQSFFQRPLAKAAIQRYQLKLIVYHTAKEEIVKWIN
ncbi:MAG: XisH family protein [Pseudomonadota bacterium]